MAAMTARATIGVFRVGWTYAKNLGRRMPFWAVAISTLDAEKRLPLIVPKVENMTKIVRM